MKMAINMLHDSLQIIYLNPNGCVIQQYANEKIKHFKSQFVIQAVEQMVRSELDRADEVESHLCLDNNYTKIDHLHSGEYSRALQSFMQTS